MMLVSERAGRALIATPKKGTVNSRLRSTLNLEFKLGVGLGLCIGSYSNDMGMAVEFDGLFKCVGEVHHQECLNVIQSIRACFRNVFGLMEDLLRVMNAAKSASLFYFMVDSTSMNGNFPSARVTGF